MIDSEAWNIDIAFATEESTYVAAAVTNQGPVLPALPYGTELWVFWTDPVLVQLEATLVDKNSFAAYGLIWRLVREAKGLHLRWTVSKSGQRLYISHGYVLRVSAVPQVFLY